MRFIALQDPADNWMVYDLHSEVPAEFTCKVLYGLSREEAEHLTVLANAKFRSRTAIAEPMLGRPALRLKDLTPLTTLDIGPATPARICDWGCAAWQPRQRNRQLEEHGEKRRRSPATKP
ncbi:hypothetical protein [Mesorhizobium opportunistum]|uniref:Uncharacterized protein n=1 Tax=Mesorhizobium opportunistum (strain LMG 24607 / HAMBI 3007 / WSM2075) TaxID=536019 RepID=F7YB89_MESOW|nr:hypothetical protein [Mesorhizobium opportunistum]AEH86559.1 hypothetical protein Mesop_2080 [Mesorhizobium opportunistum WSM2075]